MTDCECVMWARDGKPPITKHHPNCKKYEPVAELLLALRQMVDGIERWGIDEDGIPDHIWEHWREAKFMLGEFVPQQEKP